MTRPKSPPWLSLPPPYRLVTLESGTTADGSESVLATVESWRRTSACTDCGRNARTVSNRYNRVLADLSIANRPVVLRVRVRRFLCRNRQCPRRVFCERLPDLATPHAQRTDRLKQQQVRVGLALGGRPGARFSEAQGQPVSVKTLLRDVRAAPVPELPTPRCLGVDDWAFRKGCRYGTILYDLEEHRPVDLLPDRTAESLADWLKSHPGVEVISRDRAKAYAEGAQISAPAALQVADRFHLAKNLGDAVERLLNRHRTTLRQAWKTIRENEAEREELAVPSVIMDVVEAVAESPTSPDVETRRSPYEEEKRIRRAWRYGRYEQVKAYHQNGWSISRIARAMHLGRRTVRTLLRADVLPERKPYPRRHSLLENFVPDLQALWGSGCHNAAAIFRELKAKGYTGQDATVRLFVHTLHTPISAPNASAPPAEPEPEPDRCSPRLVANLVLKTPEGRSTWEQTLLAEVDWTGEPFRVFRPLAQRFLDLLRGPKDRGTPAGFTAWMVDAAGSSEVDVRRFANGLEQDRAAVEASMALPWSNGPVEGAVNRLKTIKRHMYGRANFDMLRRRVLEPA